MNLILGARGRGQTEAAGRISRSTAAARSGYLIGPWKFHGKNRKPVFLVEIHSPKTVEIRRRAPIPLAPPAPVWLRIYYSVLLSTIIVVVVVDAVAFFLYYIIILFQSARQSSNDLRRIFFLFCFFLIFATRQNIRPIIVGTITSLTGSYNITDDVGIHT